MPFIILRFICQLCYDDDMVLARYMERILNKVRVQSGLIIEGEDQDMDDLQFEEMLFLRVAMEFTKKYRGDRSVEFFEHLDKIALSFEDYSQIFDHLLNKDCGDTSCEAPNRLIFGEWVKFSLQLAIEDEVTRRNLVSLMFNFIGQVTHSYRDYQHLLLYKRLSIRDTDLRSVELAMDGQEFEMDEPIVNGQQD